MKKIGQKIIAVSIFFVFAFWIVDTVLQHFIFNKGTFLDLLILKIPHHALYIRFLISGFLLIFGLTLSRVISNLKKTDEVLQEVFEKSQDVLYKRNLKTGKYEYISPAITEIAGYTPDEMLSMSQNEIDALIHPEDLEKIYDIRKTILKSSQNQKEIFELESRIKHKDGTYRWISDHFKLNRDANGHPAFSVASVRDITKRKKTEQELQLQGEITNNLSEGIYLCRVSDGIIIYANPRFEEIFGYLPGEMNGRHVSIINASTKKTPEETVVFITGIIKKTGGWNGEIQNIKKDGSPFWCYASASIFNHPEYGEIIISVHTDITERKMAELELKISQKELKELAAHLNTVREEERALVAHELHDDIGQALSALKMDIYMIEKKLPKDQKEIYAQIKDTKDLLDKTIQTTRKIYSELRPTLLEHFSIKEVLEDHLDTFKKSNNFSGDTDIDLEGTELKEEEAICIYRIVQEALYNVKWHSHAKTVHIKLKKNKNHLEMTIEDDGIGIKEEDLTKSNSFGILGMKERASFLGGKVEFKGLPEKGTTITVTIPLETKK
ncbi:MAG: PAS domain S-box protein [Candidatus Aminicenantes bacterium]|nr:PAS domain S-box protein [Candidatus Aminicenantes bacterium]